ESLGLLNREAESINKCLQSYGGLTPETGERLSRFKDWSEGYEEIPCFTQCYLNEMFGFYDVYTGFNRTGVIEAFGEPVYNACVQKLQLPWSSRSSNCTHAYVGFHCLTKMENHPFMLIEAMTNLAPIAKEAMKDCLQEVNLQEWDRFPAFAGSPVSEPIPCFTRCFLDKLGLFDQKTRRWQVPAMQQLLGVPALGAPYGMCHRHRGRNICQNYYKQFTCYAMAK
ncbi:hypothetical protein KR074_000252, partial [Drosophila pseudoananassae]